MYIHYINYNNHDSSGGALWPKAIEDDASDQSIIIDIFNKYLKKKLFVITMISG